MEEIKRVQLSEVAELITKGTTPTTIGFEFQEQGVNFLKIECFDENGGFIKSKVGHISEECNEKLKRSQLKEGDLLFSIAGAIGRVAIVTKEMLPANTNQALAIIRIVNEQIYLPYIRLILTSPIVIEQFERKKQGVAQLNLSLKDINEISIPLPSKEKQIELADLFKKVVNIIYKKKEELLALDDLVRGRFVEMFGDPVVNSKGWIESSLSEKLNVLGGYAFKSDQFDEIDGIPVLRIGNINAGYFKPVNMVYWKEDKSLERYAMYPGDLVMSLTGTVGKDDYGNVCILGNDYKMYYLNQRNAKLEIKDGIDKYYLSQLLKFEPMKKRLTGISRGVRQANISNKDILNLVVPVPPIELQNQFAAFVHQINKSKVIFFFLNICILLICIAGTHFRMLLSKNLPLH